MLSCNPTISGQPRAIIKPPSTFKSGQVHMVPILAHHRTESCQTEGKQPPEGPQRNRMCTTEAWVPAATQPGHSGDIFLETLIRRDSCYSLITFPILIPGPLGSSCHSFASGWHSIGMETAPGTRGIVCLLGVLPDMELGPSGALWGKWMRTDWREEALNT